MCLGFMGGQRNGKKVKKLSDGFGIGQRTARGIWIIFC
jgi:hypothetical protein